ncbi:glycosyltransferase [Viridibacterium curvum]|uniref:Glycosyltransferase family 4 protein n=1 Tax=Viridibacterium curvum TaxID=1101404 RepID=A0ABP9QER2_9RHOO
MSKPKLAFVSPVFLYPTDAGGKIRTTNILRGLKGGAFDITLLSPASEAQKSQWGDALAQVCDRFLGWQPVAERPRWQRVFDLFGDLPVNVANDNTAPARACVAQTLAREKFDVVVFDFVHAAVLKPAQLSAATVCFTHNVEAEIFGRHAQTASNPLMRRVWASQYAKMQRFEREALSAFTSVIAVSERDAAFFRKDYALPDVADIPTGVDLDFFSWALPPAVDEGSPPTVVFTGSMNWDANIDGVTHFLDDVWPLVLREMPQARFVVVGRNAPASLIERGQKLSGVSFTGFVDDVRPYAHAAHAFVIPLRVGGGTRIKAFEAMAMGCPVVSTAIGIEGLDVTPDEHYLLRDAPQDQANAVLALLRDADLRERISRQARQCVEDRYGHRVAADVFEKICLSALTKRRSV